jgi:hypothetical protein
MADTCSDVVPAASGVEGAACAVGVEDACSVFEGQPANTPAMSPHKMATRMSGHPIQLTGVLSNSRKVIDA